MPIGLMDRKAIIKGVVFAGLVLASLIVLASLVAIRLNDKKLADATPRSDLHSVEDFEHWLGGEIIASKEFIDPKSGKRFSVILAPSGRILASGPSAYLFDHNGRFVEWTPDAGDTRTNRSGFDLSGKALK